jgi:hypothetical protein
VIRLIQSKLFNKEPLVIEGFFVFIEMSETKEFIQKIINSFTPNTPLIVKEFISTDDHYLVFVTLYYGHKVPSWKSEMINYLQQKILEYTQVPTYISTSKKDYDKLRTRHGVGDVIIDKDPYL